MNESRMTTLGFASHSPTGALEPFQFARRVPGDRDVHIRVEYCGICHSDIHYARGEWGPAMYPCVPGHEIIGRVVATGRDVKRFRTGQRVGVGCFVDSCRVCPTCEAGEENHCEAGVSMTYGSPDGDGRTPTFGGYSGQIVVDEHFVLEVPKSLDPAGAAPLLCAGITTYSPLRALGVGPGSRVGVMGLGGLGHIAIRLAASFGAEVTVFSHSPEKEADAARLGASAFAATHQPGALDGHLGRYDAIVDTISATHDINGALGCLKTGGTLVLVGGPPEPLALAAFSLIAGRRKIAGSLVGGIPETQEMLDHCGKHGITSDIEMIAPGQINEAWERTLRGDVRYRFVIDCRDL